MKESTKHNIKTGGVNSKLMRKFYKKLRQFFEWIPIIWKDKQHDHVYISRILIKKLELTRDFFLSDDSHIEGAKEVSSEISQAIELLKKTEDSYEHYDSKVLDELEKKWGKSKMTLVKIEGKNLYQRKIEIDGVKTEEDKIKYELEYKSKLDLSRKLYMKDKIKAWAIIAKNIDKWWD